MNWTARARTFHSQATASDRPADLPGVGDVLAAAERLSGVVRRTPLEPSAWLSARAGCEVWLKLEGLQRTGSFKLRGACNAVALLTDAQRARGLVTASAGNHGQGVALAAGLHGTRARVFVPAGAPEVKKRRIARFGAEVREVDGGYDDAHRTAAAYAAESGAVFIHSFSDPAVVAGQGTVAVEVVEALPQVRTFVVPVGGGGLIGGMGIVAKALATPVRVVGVQSPQTSAMHASLAAGRVVSPEYGETLCEGLSGDVDERSLVLAGEVVDEMVLVEEEAVRRAIRDLYVEEGVVAEGSAAVAAAAVAGGLVPGLEGPVAVVLTGANLDAARLAAILAEG